MRTPILALVSALTLLGCRESPDDVDGLDLDNDGVLAADDCNDNDDTVFPGAPELCDDIDSDCDGSLDDPEASDVATWYGDRDGDGFGDPGAGLNACDPPDGYTDDPTDCDDARPDVFPGATEDDCTDATDYNCDGSVGYTDADEDGFAACEECDDGNADVHPLADEVCDDVDNDCDGEVDVDAIDTTLWYADADADGYGDATTATEACDPAAGFVADNTDCDDTSDQARPGGTEICDTLDNDCDGDIDEADATDAQTFYGDNDADGYGAANTSVVACDQPAGFVTDNTDCDDEDDASNPGMTEVCDEADNNCDTAIDEGFDKTWYADTDGDSHGGSATTEACMQPAGFVRSNDDCNDSEAAANPSASEICDDIDNDCDTTVDEGFDKTWYVDSDGDSHGGAASTTSCAQPTGFVRSNDDCDDGEAAANPSATEICDDIDNDCDTTVDEGFDKTWYVDSDGDGFGGTITVTACAGPSGFVDNSQDCDDASGAVNPSAAQICNGIDDDCTGLPANEADGDSDGWLVCENDCDDGDADVRPDATEVWYDGVDQDCDGGSDFDQDLDGDDAIANGGTDCDDTNPLLSAQCAGGTGLDGPLTVPAADTVVNTYTPLANPIGSGDPVITVVDGSGLAANDELLVIQHQGLGAGTYEFVSVASVSGNDVTLINPAVGAYGASSVAVTQVVRVPQYTDLDVPSGASIVAQDWDGTTGGIVAFRADNANVIGTIDVSGQGFQGVPREDVANQPGEQGEGTAIGSGLDRAANGNGGGGGERNGCECCWGGAGAGGGHATAGFDGSNGGNACQLGGLAGEEVGQAEQTEWFFGGAGGQGGADEDGYGSGGGNGGGIVFIGAENLTVTGAILANGDNGPGEVNFAGCGSGGGGGGAGGAIYLEAEAAALGSSLVAATGGAGGDTPGNCGTAGGAGSDGRITVQGSSTVGTTNPAFTAVP